MLRHALIFAIGLLFASPSFAAQQQLNADLGPYKGSCRVFTLCDGTDAGAAFTCGGSGNERFARVNGGVWAKAIATKSTATAFSCGLFETDGNGWHASIRFPILAAPLTQTLYGSAITQPLGDVSAECSGVAGGVVTIRLIVCPSIQ